MTPYVTEGYGKGKTFFCLPTKILLMSELVQLKLNIGTSVGESTPTEAEYEVPLPLVEVGVSRLDDQPTSEGGWSP